LGAKARRNDALLVHGENLAHDPAPVDDYRIDVPALALLQ
jgi:hypothetical protein